MELPPVETLKTRFIADHLIGLTFLHHRVFPVLNRNPGHHLFYFLMLNSTCLLMLLVFKLFLEPFKRFVIDRPVRRRTAGS